MLVRIYLALSLATVCVAAFGQNENDLEKKMLTNCQVLAKDLNKSRGVGISPEGISPLVTWRAACAERPPTGPGNVTALCQGKRVSAQGEEGVFFWQKSQHGKLNSGYFICGGD
ncbi:hypothetical protein [Duganella caerulea]|uniref:hypothetical protein n=1 Tax=Duganella caerulea TaxID=2885762 RepID=UPI0040380B91